MEKLFGATLGGNNVNNSNNNALVNSFESTRDELLRYKRQSVDINDNPLFWWQKNSALYPHLSVYAKQRLAVSGTSVPSERVFSKAGELINAKRACLSSENVDRIIFLNKNMPLFM
jgi:hypothetical protein